MRPEALLLKTEASELVEIGSRLTGTNVEGGEPPRLLIGEILDPVIDRRHFSHAYFDLRNLRLEAPREAVGRVGVEAHDHRPVDAVRGRDRRPLGCPGDAGRRAEGAIGRRGDEGQRQHPGGEGHHAHRCARCPLLGCALALLLHQSGLSAVEAHASRLRHALSQRVSRPSWKTRPVRLSLAFQPYSITGTAGGVRN